MIVNRKLKNDDNGVVGIVVAVMLIGLIVSVVSLVQTVYVPKWMEQKESEHMEEVAAQFAQLKYAIDIHSATKQEYNPISASVTLGSGELPYLMSVRSYGQLEILNSSQITITKDNSTDYSYPIGSIEYSSSNAYYIDQTYAYECGAIILSQAMGNAFFIKPSLSVLKENEVTIYFNIINVSTIGKKGGSISGYGIYPIQTEFLGSEKLPVIQNVTQIVIKSNYATAWHSFLNGTLIDAGLNYYGYGTNYMISTSGNQVIVDFDDSIITNLHLNVIDIGAQIAPGWIENA